MVSPCDYRDRSRRVCARKDSWERSILKARRDPTAIGSRSSRRDQRYIPRDVTAVLMPEIDGLPLGVLRE
jgi:hypothetical protein